MDPMGYVSPFCSVTSQSAEAVAVLKWPLQGLPLKRLLYFHSSKDFCTETHHKSSIDHVSSQVLIQNTIDPI